MTYTIVLDTMSLKDKIKKVVEEIYGGDSVIYTPLAEKRLEQYTKVNNIDEIELSNVYLYHN